MIRGERQGAGAMAKLRCSFLRRDLTAFVDGELSARRSGRLRRHLHSCPRCAAMKSDIEAAIGSQRSMLRSLAASAGVQPEALLRNVRVRIHDTPAQRHWILQPLTLAASGVVALLIAFAFVGPGTQQAPGPDAQQVVAADLEPKAGAAPAPATPVVVQLHERQRSAEPVGQEKAPRVSPRAPAAVASNPELFVEYELFRRLEALENFDTVRSFEHGDPAAAEQRG